MSNNEYMHSPMVSLLEKSAFHVWRIKRPASLRT